MCLANLDWIQRSNLLQHHLDARWLVAHLLNAADALRAGGLATLPEVLGSLSLGGRPPLYALLGLPFVLVLGPREDAALLVNVGFQILLLAATFATGRRCGGPWVGLLAAFLVACYAPILQLSRLFTPHFALPACVALLTWRALVLLDTRSVAAARWLMASLAFGLMIHPSFVWTAAVPTVAVCLYVVFADAGAQPAAASAWRRLTAPVVLRGLAPGALAVALALIAWYASAGARLLETYQSFDEIPEWAIRGFEGVSPGFGWYARTSPGAVSNVFAFLTAAAVLREALVRDLRGGLLALSFVGAYALVNLQPSRAWWYLAAALPIAACLTARLVAGLGGRRLSASLGVLCLAVGIFSFTTVSWGTRPWSEPVARALGAPLGTETCKLPGNMVFCPNPPRRVDWKAAEILATVADVPLCRDERCRLVLVQPALFPRSILTDELRRSPRPLSLSIRDGLAGTPGELSRVHLLIHVEPRPARYAIFRIPTWDELRATLARERRPRVLGAWRLPNESVARLVILEPRAEDRP